MTKKKATIVLEGNSIAIEQCIHELQKLQDQANKQPELVATLQTQELDDNDYSGFSKATGFKEETEHER